MRTFFRQRWLSTGNEESYRYMTAAEQNRDSYLAALRKAETDYYTMLLDAKPGTWVEMTFDIPEDIGTLALNRR